MREIKFRAWNEDKKEMAYVSYMNFDNYELWLQNESGTWYSPRYYIQYIMQYIGLKDKNNKEIYEGDIVECIRDGDVLWGELVVIEDIRDIPRALYGSNLVSREVVGNIYENQDILL